MRTRISYQAIGIIHSPFSTRQGMPIQPSGAAHSEGRVEVFPEYERGLRDLAGFSHIILLYHFHQSKEYTLEVTPFLDTELRGLFATRAPARPNPIGLSILPLVNIKGNILSVSNIDILDGTPLLDIKPYVLQFDYYAAVKQGWLSHKVNRVHDHKSDDRFSEES